jgi:hypothetical protein
MSLWRDQNRNFVRNKFDIYGFITIARLISLQVAFFFTEGINRPVVSTSPLTWFIRYIYC